MNNKVYLVYGENGIEKKIAFNSVIETIEEAIRFLKNNGHMILKDKKYYEIHQVNNCFCFIYINNNIKKVNL